MNQQLQAQLSQILAQIMVSVSDVKDFSVQQLPDIAQQYVTYGIWSNILYCVILATVIFLCLILGRGMLKWVAKNRTSYDDPSVILIIPFVILIISSLVFFVKLHELILVLTAPKVWFILEIKNLLS